MTLNGEGRPAGTSSNEAVRRNAPKEICSGGLGWYIPGAVFVDRLIVCCLPGSKIAEQPACPRGVAFVEPDPIGEIAFEPQAWNVDQFGPIEMTRLILYHAPSGRMRGAP